MTNKFITGNGIHIKGPNLMSQLSLDMEKGCFLYHDPESGTQMPCNGVMQVVIGIGRDNDALNQLPFLPIRLTASPKDTGRTFRASCYQFLKERKKVSANTPWIKGSGVTPTRLWR